MPSPSSKPFARSPLPLKWLAGLLVLILALPFAALMVSFWSSADVAPADATATGEPPTNDTTPGIVATSDSHQPTVPGGPMTVGPRQGDRAEHVAREIEVTSRLPRAFASHEVANFRFDGRAIIMGQAQFTPAADPDPARAIDAVAAPPHRTLLRVRLAPDHAQSLLGRAHAAAAGMHGVWVSDSEGNELLPVGFVLLQADGSMHIRIDPDVPIRSAEELPVEHLQPNDQLYLYIPVRAGTVLRRYHIGRTTQDLYGYQVP